MNKFSAALVLSAAALLFSPATSAQTPPAQTTAPQDRLIGEVTAIDATAKSVTVKTDAGQISSSSFDDKTTFRRVPPGTTSMENAEKITSADVGVGDRVLVLLRPAVEGQTGAWARQVVVMTRASLNERTEREREEMRRRNLMGRVTAIDAAKREVTVMARSREGAAAVIVAPTAEARFLRYAPDSMRAADAVPSSFAELRVGDQLRARGERSADGARFTAEEVTAGQFVRVAGKVSAVDAARGELTIKTDETGKTVTVAFGKNSSLRRIPAEVVAEFGQRREERRNVSDEERRAQREARRDERVAERRQGEGGRPQRPMGGGGGGNLQQMFETWPTVSVADLKKGDSVLITGTPSSDQTRLTTITLLTGDAEFLQSLLRRQGGDPRSMNPGLPGDVLGGGNVNREPPTSPPL